VSSDVDRHLVINELMADNHATLPDEDGYPGDWLELFNPTSVDIPLCGYGLTDDLATPHKATLGPELTVPAGGHLLLWMDARTDAGPTHVDQKLTKVGGDLGLARRDGTYIDRVRYGAQAVDFSAAREPDGSDAWVIEWHVSPGAPNPDGPGAPAPTEDPNAAPEAIPAAGDLTERIHGYDQMPELELLVDDDAVAALLEDPRTYVPAMLVYDGREYGPVGLRLKGQNSFQPFDQKPSLRINIDEFVDGAKFFALDDLTLNNMTEDFSMMHERLAYLVARQVGPASRCNHALVTVNGAFYGLYANVETVKWHMLAHWFDDPTNPLFEATDVDFQDQYVDLYNLQSGPDDRTMLWDATDALALVQPAHALAAVESHINMPQFLDYWAMTVVVGQYDGFPYSNPGDDYFVYADASGTGNLWVLPWGMDETFYSATFDVHQVSSVLAVHCLQDPACYQAFVDHTWDLLELTEQMDLAGEIDRVAAQIAPYVAMDQRKPYDAATITEFQQQLRWFVTGRRVHLTEQLPSRTD
jgi:hypothetical protein